MEQVIIKKNGLAPAPTFKLNVRVKQEHGATRVIDSHMLEAQMDEKLGWKLSEVALGQGTKAQATLAREYLTHFLEDYPEDDFVRVCVNSNFEHHSVPVSMIFEDDEQLLRCVGTIYQLMYFHYFLGKHHKLSGTFPSYCCGISSRSLTLSLWEAGIFAAISTYDYVDDHAYVIIPYSVNQGGRTGVILADPTSDQLYRNASLKVRNYIALLPPDGWQYRTDWSDGSDLYPLQVHVSSCFGQKEDEYPSYLASAFENGARLKIKPPT